MIDLPKKPGFTTGFPGLPVPGKPTGKAEQRRRAKEFRAKVRRQTQLKVAAEVLPHLPGPGESLHALLTGTFDFMLVLTCAIQSRDAVCERLQITTLAFSWRNTLELASLLDSGKVARLTLLTSDFHAKSNPTLYNGALKALVEERKQTVASARCHCKVALLAFDDGTRLVFEGSANLRTNKNWEQVCCINDAWLHEWHASWIQEKVLEHEINGSRRPEKG